MSKVVYLSGPITKDPLYKEKFAIAEDIWKKNGYDVINPTGLSDAMQYKASHGAYMRICLELLDEADIICMLPDWEESHGASIEYGYALAKGIEIVRG